MRSLISVAYFSLALIVIIAIAARPTGPFVLVITSPKGDVAGSMSVIEKADGAFVWSGSMPWMSVAYSQAPDFSERLLEAGALLVINHDLAIGCQQGMNT